MTPDRDAMPPELRDPETRQLRLEWKTVFERYAPEKFAQYQRLLFDTSTAQELDGKTTELIMVAIDTVVFWPSPFIDVHMHAAFDAGATIAEVIDTILIAFSARGGHALNHGLTAMGKVLEVRRTEGFVAPARG